MSIPLGFCHFAFRYNRSLIDYLHTLPGCRWDATAGKWLIPVELFAMVKEAARGMGVRTSEYFNPVRLDNVVVNEKLFKEFQVPAVLRGLTERRLLLCVETGLGKSVIALETARADGCKKVLVVTQKGIMSTWLEEYYKWQAPFELKVINYERLESAQDEYDCIIFDEVHNLKNWKTARYKAAKALLRANADAMVLGLSATPIDKPEEIHALVDLLWPRRFGNWLTYRNTIGFRDTYCETTTESINGREVTKIIGLNKARISELRARVQSLSFSATKLEFGHLLPAFSVSAYRVSPQADSDNVLTGALNDAGAFTVALERLGDAKAREAVGWVGAQIEAERRKLCVVSYRVELAEQIATDLRTAYPNLPVVCVTGETAKRDEAIAWAKEAPECILVASMKSIGTGIDLTPFLHTLVVELHYSLNVMKQLLGRFSRLSGLASSQVELLTMRGTHDEVIAARVCKKVDALNELLRSGATDTKMVEALESTSEEDDLAALREAFSSAGSLEVWE